jgi:hypothetical protein
VNVATVAELETQLEAAKADAAEAARLGEIKRRDDERAMRGLELNASAEIRALRDRIEKALAAKRPATSRPSIGARGLSRKFAHQGCDILEVDRLAHLDDAFGEFFGLNGLAQQMNTRMQSLAISDDNLFAAVDALEIKTWRAVVQRAAILAGEVEA